MLILSRKTNESIIIGSDIKVTLLEIGEGTVRLGIEAPKEVEIFREEIYKAILEQNRLAAQTASEIDSLEEFLK